MKARGQELGEGSGLPRLCFCGCGEPLGSKRTYNRGGVVVESRLRPGHVVRLPSWGNRWDTPEGRRRRIASLKAYNDRSTIDAAPLVALLHSRFDTAADLAAFLRVNPSTAARLLHRTRVRRDNAERILRRLAGLSWQPTHWIQNTERRRIERDEKRRARARRSA